MSLMSHASLTERACERAFGVIRQLLFEHLTGYAGVDVADRGADPEGDATLTMDEMEHLIATWIVAFFTDQRARFNPLTCCCA